ncbi:hypothetical protein RRG08_025899 [Elysia crispata]|uniref:Uncharacterized protein n=1 Tax=Elysia crispata TaxID=231223 RepID=A0AAE1AGP8_9GAST|nr:hypothetical protein RRG08_025899 [Elysia crispata]
MKSRLLHSTYHANFCHEDGQMVKSLTDSLVSREEEERYQKNLNENEQLKIAETAQQFTERLDRMLNTPDTSLITSQSTPRHPWPKMQSGLWLLPSKVYLPNTLRIAGPPTPHRRSTQVAGTSEQVMLLTQPTTKLPCQHPSTKVMHTSAHPGVLWEEPHQTQSINDDRRGPS